MKRLPSTIVFTLAVLTVVIGAISGLTAFSIWLLVRTIQELVHD